MWKLKTIFIRGLYPKKLLLQKDYKSIENFSWSEVSFLETKISKNYFFWRIKVIFFVLFFYPKTGIYRIVNSLKGFMFSLQIFVKPWHLTFQAYLI